MSDTQHMRHALSLGRRGQGRTAPNPAVGCVIVNDGRVVGRGWTAPGGRPHAEPMALAQAGAFARGATAYVTLEPCAHHGQTPPCAEALIEAGVARVVTAIGDPDPRVAGRGHAMLRAAGIDVVEGVMAEQARHDLQGFLLRVTANRPLVTLKLALTLDGRIATASGDSQWITGPLARRHVHLMRATHDAVMVGAGTARADDPTLTVRGLGVAHQPVRIVVSRNLNLPQISALTRSLDQAPLWLAHAEDAPQETQDAFRALGADLIAAPVLGRAVRMPDVLARLAERGLTRVFCEGGGALAASLLQQDLVDRLIVMQGGAVIGAEGVPAIGALGIGALSEAPRFALSQVTALGPDVCQTWVRA